LIYLEQSLGEGTTKSSFVLPKKAVSKKCERTQKYTKAVEDPQFLPTTAMWKGVKNSLSARETPTPSVLTIAQIVSVETVGSHFYGIAVYQALRFIFISTYHKCQMSE